MLSDQNCLFFVCGKSDCRKGGIAILEFFCDYTPLHFDDKKINKAVFMDGLLWKVKVSGFFSLNSFVWNKKTHHETPFVHILSSWGCKWVVEAMELIGQDFKLSFTLQIYWLDMPGQQDVIAIYGNSFKDVSSWLILWRKVVLFDNNHAVPC